MMLRVGDEEHSLEIYTSMRALLALQSTAKYHERERQAAGKGIDGSKSAAAQSLL